MRRRSGRGRMARYLPRDDDGCGTRRNGACTECGGGEAATGGDGDAREGEWKMASGPGKRICGAVGEGERGGSSALTFSRSRPGIRAQPDAHQDHESELLINGLDAGSPDAAWDTVFLHCCDILSWARCLVTNAGRPTSTVRSTHVSAFDRCHRPIRGRNQVTILGLTVATKGAQQWRKTVHA